MNVRKSKPERRIKFNKQRVIIDHLPAELPKKRSVEEMSRLINPTENSEVEPVKRGPGRPRSKTSAAQPALS